VAADQPPSVYFSQYFRVSPETLAAHGAFNISLVTDLPLFIDPFLLFNSKKPEYRTLHDEIIGYLRFLRDKAATETLDPALMAAWYCFPEIKQTWLGFAATGNAGHGLGLKFAKSLHRNLHHVFREFGTEKVTKSSHLEKLCLIKEGVGRDNISDFTTNLIRAFLADYTQRFAIRHIDPSLRRTVALPRVRFNYETETWETDRYDLPWHTDDYVLLTPSDILTRDDTWINKSDLIKDFDLLPAAVSNAELRAQINNYFRSQLPRRKEPTEKELRAAAIDTILRFPELIDHYIRYKEDHGDRATSISSQKVADAQTLYIDQLTQLRALLGRTDFYKIPGRSHAEARKRVDFLKDIIENGGGHRLFYIKGKPIEREKDLDIMYRLTWFGTSLVVSPQVDHGRGPVDYEVAADATDKTLVEFKLASNTKLKQNLEKQVETYKKASGAPHGIKVILYFTDKERQKVLKILRELKMENDPDVVLIDARLDNKVSGSRA
jgi:hypothetical protein